MPSLSVSRDELRAAIAWLKQPANQEDPNAVVLATFIVLVGQARAALNKGVLSALFPANAHEAMPLIIEAHQILNKIMADWPND